MTLIIIPLGSAATFTYHMSKKFTNLAITVKYNVNHLPLPEYSDIYKYIFSYYRTVLKAKFVAGCSELDSKGKLHIHAHIRAPRDLLYSQFHIKTFMIYVKPITNQSGWYQYMYKDPHQILTPRDLLIHSKYQFTTVVDLLNHFATLRAPKSGGPESRKEHGAGDCDPAASNGVTGE